MKQREIMTYIYLSIYLYIYIYLSIYISIYLSIHQSIYCPKHQTISLSIFASCIKEMQKEKCKILLHTLRHCQMNPALYTAGFDVLLPYIDRMLSWKKIIICIYDTLKFFSMVFAIRLRHVQHTSTCFFSPVYPQKTPVFSKSKNITDLLTVIIGNVKQ